MYLVKAVSKIDEWKHDHPCGTTEEANEWIARQESKPKIWGRFKGERDMSEEEFNSTDIGDLSYVVESREVTPQQEIQLYQVNENGDYILEEYMVEDDETGEMIVAYRKIPDGTEIIPAVMEDRYIVESDYTVRTVDISAQVAAEKAISDAISLGAQVKKLSESVLDFVTGINTAKKISGQFTDTEIDQIEATYEPILLKLERRRPDGAKTLIEAAVPDGVLFTETEKAQILAIFAAAGI